MRNCVICGGTEKSLLKTIRMDVPDEYHLPNGYDIVCCDRCGYCYADTAATAGDYDYYYSNCNSYSASPKQVSSGDLLLEKVSGVIMENCGKEQRIVDMGCGGGGFVSRLTELGFKNVIGIDPSPESISNLNRLGCSGYVASIYDEPDSALAGTVDCLFLMSVMEHLFSPMEALENLAKYMRRGGRLFIDVPDYSKLSGVEVPTPDQFNPEHINYFSQASLSNLMRAAGFEVLEHKRLLYSSAREEYSVYSLFGVYTYTGNRSEQLQKDADTKVSILGYLQRQDELSIEREEKIASLKASGEQIVIVGVGAFVMGLWTDAGLSGCNVVGFVDNNPLKQGTTFMGHTISSFDAMENFEGTFVICSMLFSDDIKEQIISSGMKNKIVII